MEDYEVRQTMGRASRVAYQVKMIPGQINDRDGSRYFQLNCLVENVSELVGRDVSGVIFVPEHLIRQPDGYRVAIEGATYSRIPGIWTVASRDDRTAIDIHSLTPKTIFFKEEVRISLSLPPSELKVRVRVYDQFGLAHTARISLATPGLEIVSCQELPSTGRRPNISPF